MGQRQMGRRLGITERTARRHLDGVDDLSGVRGKAQPRCGVNAGNRRTDLPVNPRSEAGQSATPT
jgi:predicted transcriptional regulator